MKNPRGTLAVIGSAGAIFWPGAFIFGYPGVMGSFWQQQFGVGRGEIGNTLFFVLAAVGLFMFFVGRWQERWGTRKLVTIGALLCGLNTFLIAYADRLWLLYLWAFLNGAASSFIYIPGLTTVQRWFPERRGLVSGLVNLVFGLSAAVMAPIFGQLLDRLGYQTMNLALGGAALLLGLTAAQFTEMPVARGQIAAGQTGPAPPPPALKGLSVAQALRSSSFWFLWLTWALMGAAGIAMVTLAVPYGISRGQGAGSAVMILTAFNLSSGLSRLIMGFFSDKFSRTGGMSLTFLAAGSAYLLLPYVTGLVVILIPAAVIGYAFGTLFAVSAPLAVDCFGLKHFGAIFGLVFTAYGFLAGPLGPSLSGYLLDATGSDFSPVFSYLGCFCLISSFLVRRVRPLL
jgi:OFA family oxalate/formate antiporter-like MFS transporter